MRYIAVALLVLAAGCASINDAVTPSAQVLHDKFDNTTIIRQAPVSAAQGVADTWHTLGFEWVSKTPREIYITAGTSGAVPVSGVAFNADGKIIESARAAQIFTDIEAGWSGKRFVMPLEDFLTIARAGKVQMKVLQGDKYSVSTFGQNHPMATVTPKFQPFLDLVRQHSSGM